MIEEILQKVGLSAKEITIYLILLKRGKSTAGQIAHASKLKRTTTYSVMEELLKKKLIGKDLGSAVESYYANPPQNLERLFEAEERDIRKKKELAKRASLELSQMGAHALFSIPKITFIADSDVRDFLYEMTPQWNKSISQYDNMMWGFSNPRYVDEFAEYIEWYWQHVPSDIELKLFSNEAEVEKQFSQKYPKRHIKPWPGEKKFSSTFLICGDYIVMEYTDKEPHYIIQIHDKAMAENMRELFKTIWKIIP